jgi:diketogulonate reductase-like aldo/keto reductase
LNSTVSIKSKQKKRGRSAQERDKRLTKYVTIAYLPQNKLVDFCASKGIHCSAYSPLGSAKSTLLDDENLKKIAAAHNKSIAQILVSWGATRASVLPKSVNADVSSLKNHTITHV